MKRSTNFNRMRQGFRAENIAATFRFFGLKDPLLRVHKADVKLEDPDFSDFDLEQRRRELGFEERE